MGFTTKYTNFKDWLDACADIGYTMADIKENNDQYSFETKDDCTIAYWDRTHKFGYISFED